MATRTVDIGSIEASRRPEIEKELSVKYGVSWSFLSGVAPSRFDKDASQHNQARFEPLDPKTVEEYRDALKRGDVFPAVIAWRPGAGGNRRFHIIDGNHRLETHSLESVPLDVYEVDAKTDARTVALMTFAFNTKHGRPTTEPERIAQATYLVDNGASIDAAASAVSLAPRILRRALERSKADRRADEVGVPRNQWDTLTASVQSRLASITTDEGFDSAASLAFAARLSADECFELVTMVNATKSGKRQAEIVAGWREMHADRIRATGSGVLATGPRSSGMTPKHRLGIALGQVTALPESIETLVSAYIPAERPEAAKRVRYASERLAALAAALDK